MFGWQDVDTVSSERQFTGNEGTPLSVVRAAVLELTAWHGAVFHVWKVAGETALLRRRIVNYMVPRLLTRTAVRKTIAQGVERATWEHAVDREWKRRFAFVNCDRPQCDTYLAN